MNAVTIAALAISLLLLVIDRFRERKKTMSELDKLTAEVRAAVAKITSLEEDKAKMATANAALTAQVADLTTQLAAATAAQGTPDAALKALETELETVLDPPALVSDPVPAA